MDFLFDLKKQIYKKKKKGPILINPVKGAEKALFFSLKERNK